MRTTNTRPMSSGMGELHLGNESAGESHVGVPDEVVNLRHSVGVAGVCSILYS